MNGGRRGTPCGPPLKALPRTLPRKRDYWRPDGLASLKRVSVWFQKLLGHSSISDWDINQLADTLRAIADAGGER